MNRFHRHSFLALAIAFASLAACDDGSEADPREVFTGEPVAAAARTADGVTILEHAADALERAPRMRLDAQPLATIGADADSSGGAHARFVLLLPSGQLATLGGTRFQLFDWRGRARWQYDSAGQAPGEFLTPHGLARGPGDTLFIPDVTSGRMHRLIPNAGVVSQTPLAVLENFRPDRLAGVLPGGEFVMHTAGVWGPRTMPSSETAVRTETPVMAVDPASGAIRQITRVPDLDLVTLETRYFGQRRTERSPLRLGRTAQVAVWDSMVVTGSGDGYVLDVWAPDGRLASQIRLAVPRQPVTPEMRNARIAEELARLRSGPAGIDTSEARRLIEEGPFPDSLPPYSAFHVTNGGVLWVVDARAPGATSWSATAFDRSGAIIGRLTVSEGGVPVAFGNDRVVVRETDADGGVVLRVWRLRRE